MFLSQQLGISGSLDKLSVLILYYHNHQMYHFPLSGIQIGQNVL